MPRFSPTWFVLVVVAVLLSTAPVACSEHNSGLASKVGSDNQVPRASTGESAGATPVCVDASGPNSTLDEVADAELTVRLPSGMTGQLLTLDEEHKLALPAADPPSKDRPFFLSQFYDAVPSGGDAAFASASCSLQDGWASAYPQLYEFGITEPATAKIFASTPHLLRALGRRICWGWEDHQDLGMGRISLVQQKEQRDHALADPEWWKNSVLAQEPFGGMTFEDLNVQRIFDQHQRDRHDKLVNTPAADLARALDQAYQISVAAHDMLCPQLSPT